MSLSYPFVMTIYIFKFIEQVHYFQYITLLNLSKDYYFLFIKLYVYQVSYVEVGITFSLRYTMKLVGTLWLCINGQLFQFITKENV